MGRSNRWECLNFLVYTKKRQKVGSSDDGQGSTLHVQVKSCRESGVWATVATAVQSVHVQQLHLIVRTVLLTLSQLWSWMKDDASM